MLRRDSLNRFAPETARPVTLPLRADTAQSTDKRSPRPSCRPDNPLSPLCSVPNQSNATSTYYPSISCPTIEQYINPP